MSYKGELVMRKVVSEFTKDKVFIPDIDYCEVIPLDPYITHVSFPEKISYQDKVLITKWPKEYHGKFCEYIIRFYPSKILSKESSFEVLERERERALKKLNISGCERFPVVSLDHAEIIDSYATFELLKREGIRSGTFVGLGSNSFLVAAMAAKKSLDSIEFFYKKHLLSCYRDSMFHALKKGVFGLVLMSKTGFSIKKLRKSLFLFFGDLRMRDLTLSGNDFVTGFGTLDGKKNVFRSYGTLEEKDLLVSEVISAVIGASPFFEKKDYGEGIEWCLPQRNLDRLFLEEYKSQKIFSFGASPRVFKLPKRPNELSLLLRIKSLRALEEIEETKRMNKNNTNFERFEVVIDDLPVASTNKYHFEDVKRRVHG